MEAEGHGVPRLGAEHIGLEGIRRSPSSVVRNHLVRFIHGHQ